MSDLVVNRFQWYFRRHLLRNPALQQRPIYSARHGDDQQPHQYPRQRPAKPESPMKQNHRQCQHPQPQMPAHPSLRTTQPPGGNPFPRPQRCRIQHESKSHHAKHQPKRASATCSLRRTPCLRQIHHHARRQYSQRSQSPPALCLVYLHFPEFFSANSVLRKKASFTRSADSSPTEKPTGPPKTYDLKLKSSPPPRFPQKISSDLPGAPHRAGTHTRNSALSGAYTNHTRSLSASLSPSSAPRAPDRPPALRTDAG